MTFQHVMDEFQKHTLMTKDRAFVTMDGVLMNLIATVKLIMDHVLPYVTPVQVLVLQIVQHAMIMLFLRK